MPRNLCRSWNQVPHIIILLSELQPSRMTCVYNLRFSVILNGKIFSTIYYTMYIRDHIKIKCLPLDSKSFCIDIIYKPIEICYLFTQFRHIE